MPTQIAEVFGEGPPRRGWIWKLGESLANRFVGAMTVRMTFQVEGGVKQTGRWSRFGPDPRQEPKVTVRISAIRQAGRQGAELGVIEEQVLSKPMAEPLTGLLDPRKLGRAYLVIAVVRDEDVAVARKPRPNVGLKQAHRVRVDKDRARDRKTT
ncbi:MAG: hypothetical protein JOZ73_12225, partial [Solirubrobacterales bacterium]|nr:hypothetical protein [Solirubrobacterales bacterium]